MGNGTNSDAVIVERPLTNSPAVVWRALTQPELLNDWLMENEFSDNVGDRFRMWDDWGVVDCEILSIDPQRQLRMAWKTSHASPARRLNCIVTFTLTPLNGGTLLRIEQTGFETGQNAAFTGAQRGWPHMLAKLQSVLDAIVSR